LQGNLTLRVYDIEGDLAGSAVLVRNHLGVEDIEIGVNTLPLAEVIGEGSDIAPGLYICVAELAVTGRQGLVTARSKFAVAGRNASSSPLRPGPGPPRPCGAR